uniref:Uncharacterized protein n=1 Tax=Tanacetum cinerariifolium TaxID=118510 RepID=A0A6L2JR64_TANCI|nr:hypothetical protein [Tanacetum cinerariifolium]
MQMVRGNNGNQFRLYDGQNIGNQNGNGNVVAAWAEGNGNTQLLIAQKEEAGIQIQAAVVGDLEEIEEVNANCIFDG